MEQRLISPFVLLRQSWSLALSRPNIMSYLMLGAAPQIISLVFSAVIFYISGTTDIQSVISSVFVSDQWWGAPLFVLSFLIPILFIGIISTWYSAILFRMYHNTTISAPPNLSNSLRLARGDVGHLIVTYLVVGIITIVGFLLLVVPGILFAVWYMFAPIVAVVEPRSIDPLKESKRLVHGRFWKFAGRIVLMVLCYNVPFKILQSLHPLLGTAWSVTSPVFGLYFYLVYADAKQTSAVPTVS